MHVDLMELDMRPDGMYLFIKPTYGEGDGHWVRISSSYSAPARVSDPRTGGAYGLLVKFFDEQGRLKETIVPATAFHGSARDVCSLLADLGMYIDRDKQNEFATGLQHEMQNAPSADLAVSPGWLTPEGEVYVLPDRIFGDQQSGRQVYFGGDRCAHTYRTRGTLPEWQAKVAVPCLGNSRPMTAVAAGFGGAVMQDAEQPSGGLHFYCQTSRGKTTTLMLGGSVCGGGDPVNGFMHPWKTTSNGLEPKLAAHNDGTLFLDEIGHADARSIREFIYAIAGSVGKSRMTRELRAATSLQWRCLTLSSGEHTLSEHAKRAKVSLPGGAAIRIIDIPADAGKGLGVFEDLHGSASAAEFSDRLREAAVQYYGVALQEFLYRLTLLSPDDRRTLVREYREDFIAACRLDGAGAEVLRAANRMGVIAVGGELAIVFGILPWPEGSAIQAVATCFQAWRDSRGGDKAVHDEEQGLAQVRMFLEQYGNSKFEPLGGKLNSSSWEAEAGSSQGVRDRAGFRRTGPDGQTEFMFLQEVFKSQVCNGFDCRTLLKALEKRGLLNREEPHLTRKVRVPGLGHVRVYSVRGSICEG